ncbi:hypothetical protein [Spirabiliibacterium mucosae]|nr:hypothetical protein [Spirabiliibacterium mucosae]
MPGLEHLPGYDSWRLSYPEWWDDEDDDQENEDEDEEIDDEH